MALDDTRLEKLLSQTAKEKAAFSDLLQGRRTHKVGPAFEALVQWGLVHGLGYDCLAWDLQVRSGKRTIGALDLLLRSPAGEIEHWELAYKLYLQAQDGGAWSNWVGPNERDRLSLKVSKMLDHQLPLSSRIEARSALETVGVHRIDGRRVLLLGTLFRHWENPASRALQAPCDAGGEWARASEIPNVANHYPNATWSLRPKPHWFGPWLPFGTDMNSAELVEHLTHQDVQRPQLWTCSERGGFPFFVVPEHWGEQR